MLGLVSVTLAELGLRVFYSEQLCICAVPLIYEPDPSLGYRYTPGSRSDIRFPSIHKTIQINSSGYYGPEFPAKERFGAQRIAIAGSSNVSGIWMEGHQTIAAELQRLARPVNPGAEVLNFGVDGAGRSLATLRLIEHEILQYCPSIVLLELESPIAKGVVYRELYRGYLGDIGNSTMPARRIAINRERFRAHVDAVESMLLVPLYRLSFVVRAIHKKAAELHKTNRRSPTEEEGVLLNLQHYATKRIFLAGQPRKMTIRESVQELARIKDLVEASGASFVAFTYFKPADQRFAAAGIRTIHLGISADPGLVHRFDGHFNQKGHLVVAEALFQRLTDAGLLP